MLLGRDPQTGEKTGEQTSKATDIFQCCTQAKSCPNVNNQPYYVDDSDASKTSSRSDAISLGSRVTVIGLDAVSTHLWMIERIGKIPHVSLVARPLMNHVKLYFSQLAASPIMEKNPINSSYPRFKGSIIETTHQNLLPFFKIDNTAIP